MQNIPRATAFFAPAKANALFAAFVAAATIQHVLYLRAATANIAYQDYLTLAPLLDKAFAGTLTFRDIWAPYNGVHRAPGGLLIYVGNALLFRLDTRIELVLGAVWMAGLCLVLYERFRASLRDTPPIAIQSAFVPLVLIAFSFLQWENFVFAGGTNHLLQAFVFVAAFASLERLVLAPSAKRFALLTLTTVLTVLVFSSGYSVAAGLALILGAAAPLVWSRHDRRTSAWLAAATAVGLACLAIYSFGLSFSAGTSPGPSWWSDPSRAISFYLHVQSTQLLGLGDVDRMIGASGRNVLGGAIALLEIGAFVAAIRRGLHRTAPMPLLLIVHGQLVAGSILASRFNFGLSGALASRYVTHVQIGLLGAAWIVSILALQAPAVRNARRIGWAVTATVVCAQLFVTVREWRDAPGRKQFYGHLRHFALEPDRHTDEEIAMFQTGDRDVAESALAILRKHRLNVFADTPAERLRAIAATRPVIYAEGWFAEPEGWWMGQRAVARIQTGVTGRIRVKGYLPPDVARRLPGESVGLRIAAGGKIIADTRVRGGAFSVTAQAPPERLMEIELTASRTFVPAEVGLGNDRRELTFFITGIRGR